MPASIPNETAASGFFGARLGRHFGMDSACLADIRQRGRMALAVTRLIGRAGPRAAAEMPAEDAFSIFHHLADGTQETCWLRGEPRDGGPIEAGAVHVVDLREAPRSQFCGPLDALQFYVPRQSLDELTHEHGVRDIETLSWRCDAPDPVVQTLSGLLLATLEQPQEATQLLVDQLGFSLLAHFAQAYGGMRAAKPGPEGGLAPWQVRRAEEIMRTRLASRLTIADIARECRLTPSHFARAFRRSTGRAPHQYLCDLRVEEARKLLAGSSLPLADIAMICGFGDQSYFTRMFTRFVGTSPGAWRRSVRD